jgi:hypothetical protein
MTYPISTEVSAGQPTAADHYNNLRKDALTLGQMPENAIHLAAFLKRFVSGMKIEALATNRLRVPYDAANPATVMINGYMLQAAANVDLPSSQFSGSAALWYIFAVRSAGSTTFTLAVNTNPTEAADQRIIGTAYWDGSNVTTITPYYFLSGTLPTADYDSGWFACSYGQTYTKAHNFNAIPRTYQLLHSTSSSGASEQCVVTSVRESSAVFYDVIGFDTSNVYVKTGADSSTASTIASTRRISTSGYYRILAWK